MSGELPKTYKRAVFKEKGADLVFEQVPLELPKDGQVCNSLSWRLFNQANPRVDPYQDASVWRLPFRPRREIRRLRQQLPTRSGP